MTGTHETPNTRRRVAVAGATGLVGQALVQALCANPEVSEVHTLSRSVPQWRHPKLIPHIVNVQALPQLPQFDELYLALGTTIKAAGSQSAFYDVDFTANVHLATAAYAAGTKRIGLVSAFGANATSRIFYNRTKGELENHLSKLPLEALVIARPSLLRGDRVALGQGTRTAESLGLKFDALFRPIIPRRWRAISATDVAAALVQQVPTAHGVKILSSAAMQNKPSN